MIQNSSPWLTELKQQTKFNTLNSDLNTEITIVGGGISGVSSAYFLLENTNKKVVLIEGNKVAHGATGHNAGQIVSYFEKPFAEIVKEFGLDLAVNAQNDILSAWDLIDDIFENADLQTPKHEFIGFAGYQNIEHIILHLENRFLKNKTDYNLMPVFIAEEFISETKRIPEKYKDLYSLAPQIEILNLLETDNTKYIAAFPSRKGCMNSALFTEELSGHLLDKYSDRFSLYEHTLVDEIELSEDNVLIKCENESQIISEQVVLCTNGFENINIFNNGKKEIDEDFHNNVEGIIGYMSGYLQTSEKSPTAISYYENNTEPYFYLTRRPFSINKNIEQNLICVGGPEHSLDDRQNYSKEHQYPENAQKRIEKFLHENYNDVPKNKINYRFNWHGLMGYTKNKIRLIGPESKNPNLLYNLGCNGVGILPSIFGGKKISDFVNNKVQEKSIFDPK